MLFLRPKLNCQLSWRVVCIIMGIQFLLFLVFAAALFGARAKGYDFDGLVKSNSFQYSADPVPNTHVKFTNFSSAFHRIQKRKLQESTTTSRRTKARQENMMRNEIIQNLYQGQRKLEKSTNKSIITLMPKLGHQKQNETEEIMDDGFILDLPRDGYQDIEIKSNSTKKPYRKVIQVNATNVYLPMKGTRFILNNPAVCNVRRKWNTSDNSDEYPSLSNTRFRHYGRKKKLILVLVQSRRDHIDQRTAIRNTFGSMNAYKDWDIRVVFTLSKGMIGHNLARSKDVHSDLHLRVGWEFDTFGDIVLGPFHESTYKFSVFTIYQHVMGIRWALRFCPEARFVVKINDDHFVDTLELIENTIPYMIANEGHILCSVRKDKLHRWVEEKHGPSKENGEGVVYCLGDAYVADLGALKKMYVMVQHVPFFRKERDDVFVTGRLRQAFLNWRNNTEGKNFTSAAFTGELKILRNAIDHHPDSPPCSFIEHDKQIIQVFHKIREPEKVLNEAWCLWKNALEDKNILKTPEYQRRFLISKVAI